MHNNKSINPVGYQLLLRFYQAVDVGLKYLVLEDFGLLLKLR
jgi:hypothetical protein